MVLARIQCIICWCAARLPRPILRSLRNSGVNQKKKRHGLSTQQSSMAYTRRSWDNLATLAHVTHVPGRHRAHSSAYCGVRTPPCARAGSSRGCTGWPLNTTPRTRSRGHCRHTRRRRSKEIHRRRLTSSGPSRGPTRQLGPERQDTAAGRRVGQNPGAMHGWSAPNPTLTHLPGINARLQALGPMPTRAQL